jgi:hypothetical protein
MGVVIAEVDVDSGSSLVNLGHSKGYKHAVRRNASVCARFEKSLSHLRAQNANLAPGARCLK